KGVCVLTGIRPFSRKGARLCRAGILVLAAGIATIWCGASAQAESLREALAKAYGTNPELQSERASLRATDEGVPQALSNWRPTVTVTGDTGYLKEDETAGTTTTHPATADLTVSQPIYRGGRTVNETKQAEAEVQAGRARLTSAEQRVLLTAVRAYMNVLRDEAVLDLNRSNEQRVARQLQATQDRFRVGEITRTDVAQAEARLSRAKADRIQAEGVLVNSREAYRRVIGDAPGTLSKPTLKLALPANVEDARVLARDANPDVLNAGYREEAADYNVQRIRGELLPSVSLRGTLGTEHETVREDSRRNTAELIAELTVPLYQKGSVYSRVREARQLLAQRRQELEDARRAAVEAVASAWNALQTARAAVSSFQSEVRANEIALDGVQREALVGSRTVLDVLDAEQELLDAKVNLVRSERDELVAQFELKSAVGSLTAKELDLPVQLYDAERNYNRVRNRWFGSDIEDPSKTR
ncbi:MAG TPA: TolC family outer membrane protein, partial [Alphaproteobacteria bacterium]|nr:TolC family outer membrane protein [Alphaproteobacteria bacterium]